MYKLKIILTVSVLSALTAFTLFQRSVDSPAGLSREVASAPEIKMQLTPETGYTYRYTFFREIRFTGLQNAFEPVKYRGDFQVAVLSSDLNGFKGVISGMGGDLGVEWSHRNLELKLYDDGTKTTQDHEHQAILKDLVSLWLFPIESDTVGKYKSTLTHVNSTDSVNKIRKTKLEYLSHDEFIPKIMSSEHVLSWNPSLGVPLIIDGSETTGMQAGVQGESNYHMQLTDISRDSGLRQALIQKLKSQTTLAIIDDEPRKENLPEYAEIRWADLKQKLVMIDLMQSPEQMKVFGELMRALRIRKAKVSDLMGLIWNPEVLRAGTKSQLFKTVVGALASLGTPEAQASVVAVYQSPEVPVSGKGAVLTSLTTMQAPMVAETKNFLASTLQSEQNRNLASGAGFALSASQDASHSQAIYSAVQNAWAGSVSSDVSEKMNALDMMGNTGNEKFLPDLLGIVNNEQSPAEMKAKAVFAMRFMHSESAVLEIAARLLDPSPVVREAALDAIELQPISSPLKDALFVCAEKETNTHLRERCASLQ